MRYLPGLNTVRLFAAVSVMVVHATSDPRLLPFTLNGPDSVTLFFVLSGYLITYRLLLERERSGDIDLKAFYIWRCSWRSSSCCCAWLWRTWSFRSTI